MRCIYCGSEIPNHASQCPSCKKVFAVMKKLNYCENCGEVISGDKKLCNSCSAEKTKKANNTSKTVSVNENQPKSQPQPKPQTQTSNVNKANTAAANVQPQKVKVRICTKCGRMEPADYSFCTKCGRQLGAIVEKDAAEVKKRNNPGTMKKIIIGGILLYLIFRFIMWL